MSGCSMTVGSSPIASLPFLIFFDSDFFRTTCVIQWICWGLLRRELILTHWARVLILRYEAEVSWLVFQDSELSLNSESHYRLRPHRRLLPRGGLQRNVGMNNNVHHNLEDFLAAEWKNNVKLREPNAKINRQQIHRWQKSPFLRWDWRWTVPLPSICEEVVYLVTNGHKWLKSNWF